MVASFSEFDHSKTSFKIGRCVAAACNHSKTQCSRTTFLRPVGANLGKISSHGDNLSAQDVCESPHSGKISSNGSGCRAQNAYKGEHSSNAGSKFNTYHVGENLSSHSGDLGSQNGSGGSNSLSAAQSGDVHSENPSKMSCNLGYGSDNASKKKKSYVGEKVSLCSGNAGAQDAGRGSVGAVQQHGYGGENPRKLSSPGGNFAAYGSDNSGNLSGSVCASDNSSNYVRWSSSCTSDTTTSGSSTRRSSWESRPCSSGAAPACAIKPHKANDVAWAAIRSLQLREGGAPLGIAHFKLLRRVGHGDIGSVFLTQLRDSYPTPTNGACFFAIKVMDKEALTQRNKLQRMHMEKEILECIDHPFLPTLYTHFDTEQFSCLVMEFCPGGDLYALRQKQLGKRFSLVAARFYAAEVLLALEYLHMLGIVYRDLKPENVLVREDGHIMLTDFDLSLKSEVKPQLLKYPSSSPSSLTSSSSTKSRLLRSFSQSSTVSSSSTTSFLHHSSANCMLPAACSIHPIISCLSLSNNKSRKAQQTQKQQQKQQPACELSMKSSKVSNASLPSKPQTSSNKDRSDSGHLDISKHDMSQTLSNTSGHDDDDDTQRGASMSTKPSKYSTTDTANSGGSNGAQRTSTSGSACQEDDMMYMELVAEPTQARSMSFVGTHEYLAPEIIAGYGHGSPVDWWTFGIFLFELLFGRTPFKGASNDQTLINIIRQHLRFPEWTEFEAGEDAKSLIEGLLMKDPRKRLGSTKGATEIKQHPFFKGINWALIRCAKPPEVPTNPNKKVMNLSSKHNHNHDYHHGSHHHDITTKVLNINSRVSRSLPHFDYF